MQGTRERILEFIVRNREARVEDLAAELSITAAAVRRHLDHLRADGMVDVHAVRQATGRPYHVYIPTERAAGALPVSYAGLIERVLRSLDEDDPFSAAVSGRMAESVAEKHRAEVSSTDPDGLVAQVTASLRTEGILESWSVDAEGYHLINGACPYRVAAEISNLPCESDRKAIELLLGAHVEQVHRIVDGSPICEYVIRGAEDLIPLRETTRNTLPLGQGV
ncbi:MAG TPA: ArsR family transcriptional regulator [Tepidiformaceae bacterium]|nr:ArsR family transcriptional regulator [Tepidiformaceae bacterium]